MERSTTIITQNERETRRIANAFAEELAAEKPVCHVVSLEGELGAGKTTFMKGFAEGLHMKETMTSPTFIIFRVFDLARSVFKRLYHVDCYRLESYEDLRALGFEDILNDPKNLVVIEWGNMIREHLPQNTVHIAFDVLAHHARRITITS
ncbi:MAG: tRNA (adenosine(37)-N6)-threonylcarbamoyltransferase complex ATPase subunit type 1 TsaE [Patescibacteria group bacterium]|nr:tRNA (adenosine(37)-N6)-threonylcarbamoyltransferase complex ATPase subunit type 1 TsaE [Patescibacteria group bacterium]MDE2438468.1 tRNA (adenosine(37)-N6)-threonylcarbamoyltransferase complex ATPase subunit type 1 TsaE [Patescibacteria group bacterium]